MQQALGLGVVDHGPGDAVLHGSGGVQILQLRQNAGLQAVFLLQMGQLQQGGAADQLIGGGIDMRHGNCSFLL